MSYFTHCIREYQPRKSFSSCLINCPSDPDGNAPNTVFELIALLRVSRQWLAPAIANWAIKRLDLHFGLGAMGPSLALQLSSAYRTFAVAGINWIDVALRMFFKRGQARMISRAERDIMGADTYAVLVEAFETIQEKLLMICAQAPGLSLDFSTSLFNPCDATRHHECRHVYNEIWMGTIARKLLMPQPISGPTLSLARRIPFSVDGFQHVRVLVQSEVPLREENTATTRLVRSSQGEVIRTKTIAKGCRDKFLVEAERLFHVSERITVAAINAVQVMYEQHTMDLNV